MSDRDAPRPDKEQRPAPPGTPEFDPSQAEKAAASFRPVWDTGEDSDLDADWSNVPAPAAPASSAPQANAAPKPATTPSDRPSTPSGRPSTRSDRPSGQPSPASRSQQKTLLGLSAPVAEELRRAAEASAARAAERAVSAGQPEPLDTKTAPNPQAPAAQRTIMGLAPVVVPKSATDLGQKQAAQSAQPETGRTPASAALDAPVFAAAARQAPKTAAASALSAPDSADGDLDDSLALGRPSGRPWIALGGIVAALVAVGIVIFSLQASDNDLELDRDLSESQAPVTKTDEALSASSETDSRKQAGGRAEEPAAETASSAKPVEAPAPTDSAIAPAASKPKAPPARPKAATPPPRPAQRKPKPPAAMRAPPPKAPVTTAKPEPAPTPSPTPPPAPAKPKPAEGIVRETPF